jgi:hypothetical protein
MENSGIKDLDFLFCFLYPQAPVKLGRDLGAPKISSFQETPTPNRN